MNENNFENDPVLYIKAWILACNKKAPMYATTLNISKKFDTNVTGIIDIINELIKRGAVKRHNGDSLKTDVTNDYLTPGEFSHWTNDQPVNTYKDIIDSEFGICRVKIIRTLAVTGGLTPKSLMETITEHGGGTVLVTINRAIESNVIEIGGDGTLHITPKGLKIYSEIGGGI